MRTPDPLLNRFATQHAVDLRDLPDPECHAVRCMLRCTDALDADYAALPQQVLASDPVVGLIWQLLARCAEHVEGAVTAFATASGSAPEVLSRAAIESAVTIRFILVEPRPRLAAYFRHHVDEVERQVRQWEAAAASLPEDVRALHTSACERRALANQRIGAFVDLVENEILGSQPRTKWPSSLVQRFQALQDEITYRTVYARLCSETHFDAEETLRYMMGQLGGDLLIKRMALETIGFTRLMIAIAVCYYLRAVGTYAACYEMPNAVRQCRDALTLMEQVAEELSEHVGGMATAGHAPDGAQ